MTALSAQSHRGVRDYYPKEKRLQNYIFSTWREVVESFGYEEYGAPILENLEIYAAKSGQELVNEQTYTFTDRGGREVAIRPEMTPSISRMVAARRQDLPYPARLYSIANFMRYERPQRGREREFWQLNVDLFGVDSVAADVEIIALSDAILKRFGAQPGSYKIRVNNRKLITFMMREVLALNDADALAMTKLFDRKDKLNDGEFNEQLMAILGEERAETAVLVKSILAAKSLQELPESLQSADALDEIKLVFDGLKSMGVAAAEFDATLMRGLDYYTGTVFEVFDTHPDNNRSLFGGGRYDGLVGLFGAEPISAVGAAPGTTMFEHFLEVHGLLPEDVSRTKVYIAVIQDAFANAYGVAAKLRAAGINVEVDISGRKLDKQIKTADKKGISQVLFIGPRDVESGQFTLKQLATGAEESLTIEALIAQLQ